MHKKLAADLMSLAHSILQIKNKDDVLTLKQNAYKIYEKLTVLAYINEYLKTTPSAAETKEALLDKIKNASEQLNVNEEHTEIPISKNTIEQPFEALEEILFENVEETIKKNVSEKKPLSLEEELQDTISVDVAADLFEKITPKKSLNEQLQTDVSIGLNDRIAFVKNLFNNSQEDFNRVISQLNTFKTEKEVKNFIAEMIKPDYNWEGKEEIEERFVNLVTLKFL